ncbi:MAG TPA: Ig-like domain-containing protein [Pyrinomonadaceae bacterium]|nr:Ig-like domain-containing protein [Pyrinomonadaceae bacterium]
MKTRISLLVGRRHLKLSIACLLSFSMLTMPLVPMASAMGRSDRQALSLRHSKSSPVQPAVKLNLAVNAPVPAPAPEPFAPVISATKVDALINDDGDGKADPGSTEKIEYTVTISNTGTTDATNVTFTDPIDPHTTLVGGSITTQPIAVADSYSAIGNVRITVPDGASDLLGNDCDPNPLGGPCTNAGLTISTLAGDNSAPFAGTSAQGGQVTATAGDGSFQYNPAPGFEGTDTFTYTVTDATGKTDTATVTITVAGMIWFISASAGAGGDGRLVTPFNCLVGTGCFSGSTLDEPGDYIFLSSGTYNDNAALVLLNNQKVIGAAATVPLAGPGSVTGFTIPTFSDTLPATNQASPVVTSTASGIQLASGNLLRGFTVGNTATSAGSYDILNTSTATVGTLNILEVILNGTGGLFRADSGGTLNVNFASAATTSAGSNGFHIAGATSGTVTVGAGGTISGVAGSDVVINGGTVAFSCAGGITHSAATAMVDIANHTTSTVSFTGALSATNGTGLQFNNADGTYNFNGSASLNGGDAGIDITGGSGGTFSFNSSTAINNPSGTAYREDTSTANVTYSGTITKNNNAANAVDINAKTGGTTAFGGSIVASTTTANAIDLTNTGGTVNFTGGLDITTTSGFGFNATGSGATVNATQNNTSIVNTINSGTGTALNVSATTIGASGLTFRSISANGGANGIVLANTGSSGGLTVTGNSSGACGGAVSGSPLSITTAPNTADCTGGRIQLTTGADGATSGVGISLTSTQNVSLTRMRLDNHSNFAIKGSSVTGLTLNNVLIDGVNGSTTSPDEGSINITNLLGTSSMTNSTVRGGFEDNINILNNTGTGTFTITGSTIRDNSTTTGNDGVFAQSDPGATFTLKVINSVLQRHRGDHVNTTQSGNGVINTIVTGNTMTFNGTIGQVFDPVTTAGGSITLTTGSAFAGTSTFNVSNNNITGAKTSPINVNNVALNSTNGAIFSGTISGNVVGLTGAVGSGSDGDGIDVTANGDAEIRVNITNNNVRQWKLLGISLIIRDGNTPTIDSTITGNTVGEPSNTTESLQGIIVNSGAAGTENGTSCADIGGTAALQNSFPGTFSAGVSPLRVRARANTVVRLPGYGGGATDITAVANFLSPRNNNVFTTAQVQATGTFTGGAACNAGAAPNAVETSDFGAANKTDKKDADKEAAVATTAAAIQTSATTSQPSILARAMSAIADFANGVHAAIEPTAYASEAIPTEMAAGTSAPEQVQKSAAQAQKVVRNHVVMKPRAVAATPPMMAGETVGPITIGTLRPGDSVVITFQVFVNDPPNLTGVPPGTPQVENQGQVSYAESPTPVKTDDPSVVGAEDKTATPVDLFNTSTSLISSLNPSNFGDNVTFTATVSETPAQATADPSGTVDFIDTSNGNAVVCNDVPLNGSFQAACSTSTLTAGTHNIRADYSGDGNFDPSQSNVVAQVVIACTPNPIVTSTADSGAGTLREAIGNVCSGTTITFNLPGAGPHTITLTTGELPVTRNVSIKNNSGEKITVSGNNASRVFNINSGKTVSIIGLTISGGNAANGGGILNDGALTVVNSTISGNSATSDGAGIGNTATATSMTLINTTISGNTANGFGGGVDVLGGAATIINATITNNHGDNDNTAGGGAGGLRNQGGTVTMHNTIVAGNFSGSGTGTRNDIEGALQAASSNNLIGDGTNMTGITDGVNGNQVGSSGSPINPQLGSLADNGGLTQTHALLSTSTAIEAGSNANLPVDTFDLDGDANTAETLPVDQRGTGFPRVADSADANVVQTVDIGAFELHPSIEDIPNQSTNEDTTKNVTFNLGDDTGALIATVAATSSNTTLVPNANLSFTGSGGSRTLQIIPATNQSGTTTITVTVTATNGRTATDTFDLTVSAVNDPPSGTDNTVSTPEDTAYTFTAADFGFSDPNDTPPNTLLAVKITTLPALGTLTNNNVPVNAGDFIPVANITGGLLKFTPVANGNGTPYTSFTFQVQDNGGGTDLDPTPNTMTINVTAVNDGPTNTVPGPQNTNEDTALVFSSGNANQISVADPDAGANPVKITLTATNGTITLSTTAGLAFITGDGTADATMMFTGTLTAVNTALNGMSFTPTANFSGAASLQIVSDDQGNTGTGGPLTDTDSVNITVNAVNDPPSGTDNTVSTAEDTAYTFTVADFGFSDPNDTPPNTLLAVKITTLPALGTLTNNNVPVNAGDFIPVANITGGLLKFTPAANGNGTPYTSFTFQVQDNGGGTDLDPTPNTMTINVTAVNDGPTNTVPGPQNTNEDTALVFSSGNANQISVADPDAGANPVKITLTATNGTITLSTTAGLAFITGDGTADATMMFTGTLTAINTALNGMSFNPTADFNGPASLQIVSDDQGNTGSGGPLTDTDTVSITVNAQNDAPVVTTSVGNTTFTENGAPVAVDNAVTVTDGDSPNLVSATVAITAGFVSAQDTLAFTNTANITGNYVSGTGVLTLTGSDTVANYQAALRSITYSNSSDNPTASRTVSFTVNDGSSNSNTATKGITINAVNDGPVNTVPGPQSTNQNTPLTFSSGGGNQISVADLDAGANSVQITLTATNGTITLSGTAGLAFTVGDGTADTTMTFTGTLANINTALNGMTFTPTNGFSGAASLTITSNDQGNTGSGGPLSDTDTVNIQVSNNITIQDAQVVEPSSGTVNMIFTVTLSAPAPAGGVSVNFTTQDQPPAINHATAGADYTTTSGTVNFAVGEQIKTILVPVKADGNNSEVNETFLVVLSSPVNGTIADGTATGTILVANQAGAILISELRTSGPAGAGDDFVEIYNNSDSPHTVNGANGGYGLFKMGASCSATPILIGVIPNGTVIPARGHYLFVGSAYSLANYGGAGAAAGDQTMSSDIESDRNVAIFSTGSVIGISSANRLDAVGFGANTGGTCDLLREGATLTPMSGSVLEYSFFRDECGKSGNPAQFGPCPTNGFMADTNVNHDDFVFVDTTGVNTPAGQLLGAPGPQNLASARFTINVTTLLLDSTIGNPAPPNRVRDNTPVTNGAAGTMSVRRRFVNNTGAPVTKLKFRIVDFTSLGSDGIADLRVLSSGSFAVSGIMDSATCQASNGSPTTPCTVTVQGTTLETPPNQPVGGAMNSSVNTGTITLGTPLAPGASINLQILLGVEKTGSFKFFFNIEALP